MNFKKTLLFTGAGFTANFNGFLAREMWSWIFNNPKLDNAGGVKLKLKDPQSKFDFEQIYSDVFDSRSNLPEHEVEIFKQVVNEAYITMDKVIQSSWDSLPIHPADLQRFLNKFIDPGDSGAGACFTLNQDMLLEKRLGWRPLCPSQMNYQGNWGDVSNQDLAADTSKTLPSAEELEEYKNQTTNLAHCYIKLHGSLRWVSQEGNDSKVIGINKMNTIRRIPLLNWYFELFNEAIVAGDVKLVIVGYGFRDPHINDLLATACENHGLKLFIISPQDPEAFLDDLLYRNQGVARSADPIGSKIWNGVSGYFQYRLSKIIPREQRSINPELTEFYKAIGV